MCLNCWQQTYRFHKFHEIVHVAQANYLAGSVKSEEENDFGHFEHVSTIVPNRLEHEVNETAIKIEFDAPPSPQLITVNEESQNLIDEETFRKDVIKIDSTEYQNSDFDGKYPKMWAF